jgi:hypothetical protein
LLVATAKRYPPTAETDPKACFVGFLVINLRRYARPPYNELGHTGCDLGGSGFAVGPVGELFGGVDDWYSPTLLDRVARDIRTQWQSKLAMPHLMGVQAGLAEELVARLGAVAKSGFAAVCCLNDYILRFFFDRQIPSMYKIPVGPVYQLCPAVLTEVRGYEVVLG